MKRIVKLTLLSCLTALLWVAAPSSASAQPSGDLEFFEMRVYHTHPGKLEGLHDRFRDHTLRLFEKHGMANIGYWEPIEGEKGAGETLIFVLGYPSREARERSWKAFVNDPEWQAAYKESHKDGPLVAKADSTFLKLTDYTPEPAPNQRAERLFELRTYTTPPGKLDDLHARFRNHTIRLFSKHGISHIAYCVPVDEAKGAKDTLIYMIAHSNREAREKSFDNFRQDPAWISAKEASEKEGSLTAKIEVTLLKPTDYSLMK